MQESYAGWMGVLQRQCEPSTRDAVGGIRGDIRCRRANTPRRASGTPPDRNELCYPGPIRATEDRRRRRPAQRGHVEVDNDGPGGRSTRRGVRPRLDRSGWVRGYELWREQNPVDVVRWLKLDVDPCPRPHRLHPGRPHRPSGRALPRDGKSSRITEGSSSGSTPMNRRSRTPAQLRSWPL
jgi:hypothetical protein